MDSDSVEKRIRLARVLIANTGLPFLIDSSINGEYIERISLPASDGVSLIGGKLKYVKSGTTGHTFKGIIPVGNKKVNYGFKVSALPRKSKTSINDINRPENVEIAVLVLLSRLVKLRKTPHITLPITTFTSSLTTFANLTESCIGKDNRVYKKFMRRYKAGKYRKKSSILVSEWANCGDFLDFIRQNGEDLEPLVWKTLMFQIISTLAVIQAEYPTFRHNDLKANNILVHKVKKGGEFMYCINGTTFRVPNVGYIIRLWDFDFACIPGIINNLKVLAGWSSSINITPEKNRYYDIHYFFNTLVRDGFYPILFTSDKIPIDLKDFIARVIPRKYRNGECVSPRGRILINDEFMTPDYIVNNDKYFKDFRH